jgi:hypothetical protein
MYSTVYIIAFLTFILPLSKGTPDTRFDIVRSFKLIRNLGDYICDFPTIIDFSKYNATTTFVSTYPQWTNTWSTDPWK